MSGPLDYGSLMDAEEQRLKPAASGGTDYGAMMDTEAQFQKQRLTASLVEARKVAPDKYGETVRNAGALGVPPAAVEGAPADAELQLAGKQADALLRDSPRLAAAMASPDFAKLAHDDADNLGFVEKVANAWRRGFRTLLEAGPATALRANAQIVKQIDDFEAGKRPREADDPMGLAYMTPEQRAQLRMKAMGLAGGQASTIAQLESDKRAIPADPIVSAAQSAKSFSDFWYYFKQKPLEFIATVGAESLPASAPGMLAAVPAGVAGGAPGVAAALGSGSFFTDYSSSIISALQSAGVDTNDRNAILAAVQDKELMARVAMQANAHATGVALLDAASGGIAGKSLAPAALKGAAKGAANLAIQAPVQGGLGALGEVVGSTMAGQPIEAGSAMAEFFGEFAGTPGEVLSATAGKVYDRVRQAEAAANDALALAELGRLRQASKLAERSPQAFADFVQSAAEDGPVQDVYVDAKTLLQSGMDLSQLKAETRQEIADAAVTGGDVRIPLGDYAAHLAGQGDALLQHLKTSPEGMSQAEAQTFLQGQVEEFRAEAERALASAEHNPEFRASADQVKAHFFGQLTEANRFTSSVNEAYASLARDFYTVMAQRLGITPVEMLQRYPLRVAAENVAGQVLNQRRDAEAATRTPEFQKWFEGSKVVDASGAPVVVNRQTHGDFTEFNRMFPTEKWGRDPEAVDRVGLWFTSGSDRLYGPKNMQVYLNIKNPLEFQDDSNVMNDPKEGAWAQLRDAVKEAGGATAFRAELVKNGLDGILLKNTKLDGITQDVWIALEPNQIKDVRNERPTDSPNILEQSHISDVGHRRENATGRYVGAPDWVGSSPQALTGLRQKLRQLALEGEPGRHWYERSSKAILEIVGGDKAEAEKVVALIAIYSPNATVPANTSMALTAYYQFKAGRPIKAGFGQANEKALELLRDGKMWSGIKTNSFYQNLMQEIDPSKNEPGAATMDMWMAIAFDYGMKAVDQGPKYAFMLREVNRLGQELGWPAHQVQAAIWTAIKGRVDPIRKELKRKELKRGIGEIIVKDDGTEIYRIKPERRKEHFRLAHKLAMAYDLKREDIIASKYDFSDAIEGRLVQISWEATPGETSGVLPGMLTAPLEQKAEYLREITRALVDENGRDLLAAAVGLPEGTTLLGFSAWKGDVGAGAQTFLPVPSDGSGKTRAVKVEARELLNRYAALKAYVLAQDAVVWHQPVYDDAMIRHNGVDLKTARPLTAQEMRVLYDAIHVKFGTWEIAPGYTQTGARLLNFVEGISSKAFQAGVDEILAALPDDFGGGMVEKASYRSDGEYIGNNWQESRDGENYKEVFGEGRPDLLERAEQLRARVAAVNERFAAKYGWDGKSRGSLEQAARDSADRARDRGAVAARLDRESALARIPEGYSRQVGPRTPLASARRGKNPAAVVGIHYGNVGGLSALNANLFGSGARSAELGRIPHGSPMAKRAYFYIQQQDGVVPESEGVVKGGFVYRSLLDNLYDFGADPEGIIAEFRRIKNTMEFKFSGVDPNTLLEDLVLQAGYDGYINRSANAVVVMGQDAVPVEFLGTRADAPAALAQTLDQPAYHGSPHDFEKFSLDKNGTPVTPEERAAYMQPKQESRQPGQPRGQITLGATMQDPSVIQLLKNADLSTFVHEFGHFQLEVLADIASRADAPAQVREDMRVLLEWFGVKGDANGPLGADGNPTRRTPLQVWQSMTLGEKRDAHEKFARGFEAYLFEGRSPSTELQAIFARFRAWLIAVYKSITALNVELTDEVRSVMDRLIATDEQIASAQALRGMSPMFRSAEEAKATTAEWEAYQGLGAEATDSAARELEKRSLADLKWSHGARSRVLRKLQEEAKSKRSAIREEVEAQVYQEPVYAAMRWLKDGTLPTGEKTVGAKLDLKALKEMYGEDPAAPWRYLPTGERGLAGVEGLPPDAVAEMFGFKSGDELVRALLAAEPVHQLIEGKTDQRMLEEHGDLVDDAAVQKAADKTVHNELRARVIASELRFLERQMGVREKTGAGGTVNVLARAAKQFAETIIARKKVKDVKPAQYSAAEARAAKAALLAKSPAEKVVEKRNQLVNNYAARIAAEAVADIEKSVRYLKKFDNEGTRKNIDQEYLDQIDQLLERFDLRKVSQAELDRRVSLTEWVKSQEEQGLTPSIDKALLAEARRQHFSRLTVEEFRGLVEAVKNIEHLGRLKRKLLTAKDEREFAAVVAELGDSIRANANGTVPERKSSDRGPLVAIGTLFRNFMADHRKFASLAREMDGWRDAGPMWERLVRTMNEAGNHEAVYREGATVKLGEIFAPILKNVKLGEKRHIPAVAASFTREELLGIALNMGNEVNRERVMTGEKWTAAQLNAVLDTLSKEEWDFVQAVWNYLDSFRPEIAAKTLRVTGITPEWVEAQPVFTKWGVYKGGYYPIKYDPLRSDKAEADTAAEVQRQMERGLYVRAQTRRGHLEARVESTGRPMRYGLDVITEHVDQVIHDLAWHEWLIDANRLLRAPGVANAVREHYGPEKLRTMRDTLRDIAIGEIGAQTAGDRLLGWMRHGATIAGLGWRLTTAIMQPLGLTQSAPRVGTRWMAKGAAHWFGDAVKLESSFAKIAEKSEMMRLRGKTMQREINEIRNKVTGKDSALEASYFYLIAKMQLVADVPTWWGAYEKAMHENGMNEAKAVQLADQAVLDAQGGGQVKDLSGVQRGSAAWKLFTNFYSFFNTTYNLTRESIGRTNFKSAKSVALLAADMALLYSVPALLGTVLKAAMKGEWDEDKFWRRLAADQLNYLLGTVVVLRELGAAGQAAFGMQGSDYQGPASVRLFVAVSKLAKQAEQGDLDEAFWKALNEVGGLIFHYPAGQINATASGLAAMADGRTANPGVLIGGAPAR